MTLVFESGAVEVEVCGRSVASGEVGLGEAVSGYVSCSVRYVDTFSKKCTRIVSQNI